MSKELLRQIPQVSKLVEKFRHMAPEVYVKRAVRETLKQVKEEILSNSRRSLEDLDERIEKRIGELSYTRLRRVINATGVVINTNLGRSVLSEEVADFIKLIATHYSNLEYDLKEGKRGSRQAVVEDYLKELTGAESALVVNNNAGAVFLVLNTLASGKEVVVSRGELVEIGGSFRIPDIMRMSGARLVEVGTTNRTRLDDYKRALCSETALLMKVHRSNFYMEGFVQEVSLEELLSLGLPVYYDAGSGALFDLRRLGLRVEEPSFESIVALGVHVVSGSGDKLLGGPQAGIILGKREFLEPMKKNPMSRVMRIDKLTLAGLEMTLRLYLEGRYQGIPTIRLLTLKEEELKKKALKLAKRLKAMQGLEVRVIRELSQCGGGSLPSLQLPTYCVGIRHGRMSVGELERRLRFWDVPIIGRVKEDMLLMDVRTLLDEDYGEIERALSHVCQHDG